MYDTVFSKDKLDQISLVTTVKCLQHRMNSTIAWICRLVEGVVTVASGHQQRLQTLVEPDIDRTPDHGPYFLQSVLIGMFDFVYEEQEVEGLL